jgi:probable phosphoglycerate mutase
VGSSGDDGTGRSGRSLGHRASRLLLIRHGEQEAVDGAGIGRSSHLSRRGRQQASAVAEELAKGPRLRALYTSSLPRAIETANLISERLALEATADPRLAEFELGTKPIEAIRQRSDLLIWRPEHTGDDGETLRAFSKRVAGFCSEITELHLGGLVAIVSHAGVIDAAVRWALGMPASSPWQHEVEVQHASISELEFWPSGRIEGGAPRYAVIRRLNQTSHLGELVSDL